jgi:hypothetical protein
MGHRITCANSDTTAASRLLLNLPVLIKRADPVTGSDKTLAQNKKNKIE